MRWVWTERACIFILRLCHTTATSSTIIIAPTVVDATPVTTVIIRNVNPLNAGSGVTSSLDAANCI